MKKKKILKVLFVLLAILTFGIITACTGGDPINSGMMTYYGCPNSKRVVKLNTRKH